jgi:6-phosphogluconolactonase
MSSAAAAPRVTRFALAQDLAQAVARAVAAAVQSGVRARGRASLVLPGGSTPESFLPAVAALPIPWEKVDVLLADERWVGEDSPDSNAAMLRRHLLSAPGPSRARFVPLHNDAPTAALGVEAARAALPSSGQPYDLVLLGMGADGHFASLFPGSPRLAALLAPGNTERVAAVPAPASAAPAVERITMTLAELRRADRLVLVLQSQRKLDALAGAFAAGDPMRTPVVALDDPEVFWSP